ncbi:hypothetical protein AURDEDRAFT_165860 [Auricularia subglabra TFB-10046 SS5]|nr:hypothetical protein AURDEDRAFT_165860 [Auricularia subglabra TFB-10046 SS5]
MSALKGFPEHLAPSLAQLIERVIERPEVYDSEARLEETITDFRLCVDNVIADALTSRNNALGRRLRLLSLPDDALRVISEHLPFTDLLSASRSCRRLQAVTLSCPSLWSDLDIRVSRRTDEADEALDFLGDEDAPDDPDQTDIVSNIALMSNIVARGGKTLLTLTIAVTTYRVSSEVVRDLGNFLTLVSPRLSALHVRILSVDVVDSIFGGQQRVFPHLRELVVSPSDPANVWDGDNDVVDLSMMTFPQLKRLELHSGFGIKRINTPAHLKVLRCDVADVSNILPVLLIARELESFSFRACGSLFFAASDEKRLLLALNAIPDVRFRLHNCGSRAARVFHLVDLLARPQALVEFECPRDDAPICLTRSDRLSPATEIVVLDSPTSIDMIITDASARTTTIRLIDQPRHTINLGGEHTQAVDWTPISSLDSLTSLRVDASIWRLVMQNFPIAPRLANTTLRVADPSSLDTFFPSPVPFAMALEANVGLSVGLTIGIPQLALELGLDDELDELDDDDERPRAVPEVPAGSSLTISADAPVSIAGWCVGDVMDILGVDMVKLDNVVMEGDRAWSEQALPCDSGDDS